MLSIVTFLLVLGLAAADLEVVLTISEGLYEGDLGAEQVAQWLVDEYRQTPFNHPITSITRLDPLPPTTTREMTGATNTPMPTDLNGNNGNGNNGNGNNGNGNNGNGNNGNGNNGMANGSASTTAADLELVASSALDTAGLNVGLIAGLSAAALLCCVLVIVAVVVVLRRREAAAAPDASSATYQVDPNNPHDSATFHSARAPSETYGSLEQVHSARDQGPVYSAGPVPTGNAWGGNNAWGMMGNAIIVCLALAMYSGVSNEIGLPVTDAAAENFEFRGCKILEPETDIRFRWTVVGSTHLYGRIEGNVAGWLGVGFSTDGTMASAGADEFGSDIIVGWADESKPDCCVHDYSANEHTSPLLDASQDVKLLSVERVGDRLAVEFSRRLYTEDEGADRDLVLGEVVNLIWAGSEHLPDGPESLRKHSSNLKPFRNGPGVDRVPIDFSRHQNECQSSAVRLKLHLKSDTLTSVRKDIIEAEMAVFASKSLGENIDVSRFSVGGLKDLGGTVGDILKNCADCKTWDVTMDNFELTTDITQYMCFGYELPIKEGEEVYVIALEALVDNEEVNHHMTIGYGAKSFLFEDGTGDRSSPRLCSTMPRIPIVTMWVSAVGTPAFMFPKDTGFKLGYGDRFLRLVYHYDNPTQEHGLSDSSGIRLVYKTVPQTEQVRVATMGAIPATIQPGLQRFVISRECAPVALTKPVKLFALWPHAHGLGKKIWITLHGPGGKFKGYVVRQLNYQFDSQNTWFLDPPVVIENGDRFQISCQYNSTTRAAATKFGPETADEMCVAALYFSSEEKLPAICPKFADGATGAKPVRECSFPCVATLNAGWGPFNRGAPPNTNPFAPDIGTTGLDNGLMVIEGVADTTVAVWTAQQGAKPCGTIPYFRPQPSRRSIHLIESQSQLVRLDIDGARTMHLFSPGMTLPALETAKIWCSFDNIILDTADPSEWQELTMGPGWRRWGSKTATPQVQYDRFYPLEYHVTRDGFVSLHGLLDSDDWINKKVLTTLPALARPSTTREFVVATHTGDLKGIMAARIKVEVNGVVTVEGLSGDKDTTWKPESVVYLPLSGVHFFAEPSPETLKLASESIILRTRVIQRNAFGIKLVPGVTTVVQPMAVRVGRMVCLRGVLNVRSDISTIATNQYSLGTIDASVRPSVLKFLLTVSSAGARRVDVAANGELRIYGAINFEWIRLDGMCYVVHQAKSLDVYYQ